MQIQLINFLIAKGAELIKAELINFKVKARSRYVALSIGFMSGLSGLLVLNQKGRQLGDLGPGRAISISLRKSLNLLLSRAELMF